MKRFLILLLSVAGAAGCTRKEEPACETLSLVLHAPVSSTRAALPDAQKITDCNLLIFNSFGILEDRYYAPARVLAGGAESIHYTTTLLKEGHYTVLAAANLGYELRLSTLEEAHASRFYLAYPDEYARGIPMTACLENVSPGESQPYEIPLQRLMARVQVQVDRSALDPDIQFQVRTLRVGNCPSSALLFTRSKVETRDQLFTNGFAHNGREVDGLNRDVGYCLSEAVDLYLLENCQGNLLEGNRSYRDKVFTDSRYGSVCSYIQLEAEYYSPAHRTAPGSRIVYRCYLGDSPENFDVERNASYCITVRPEGDGLSESSWRVDTSGLE